MERRKRRWQRVDGVLLLDKPTGLSSNDALQKARRLYSAEKGGHTGTLDPLASGLLPLCFGEATKFGQDLLDADKTYLATLRLGERTATGDADGSIVEQRPVRVGRAAIEAACAGFVGTIRQVPPMYSALKRNGIPLYKLARQGAEVEREARSVRIMSIDLLSVDTPLVTIRVCCSKGTYIRVLAEDLGERLGCGAHLVALRRERVGAFALAQAHELATLAAADDAARAQALLPVDALLQTLPRVDLGPADAQRFAHGNPVSVAPGQAARVRVYGSGATLLGTGRRDPDGRLAPVRLTRADGA
jgi:tRNA pseudouridine55 synthase